MTAPSRETRIPRRSELAHWWRVASSFPPWDQAFWLSLMHDTVEDGYLTPRILRGWPGLDAITHREGEGYWPYVRRAARHPVARRVKLADARDNWNRPNPRLKYWHVIQYLTNCGKGWS